MMLAIFSTPSALCTQVSTLVSLGQVQTDEGRPEDAVETYLQVLRLQEHEDADEVAEAHLQARHVRRGGNGNISGCNA